MDSCNTENEYILAFCLAGFFLFIPNCKL